ncbi:hypothetical protein RRG08_007713 [Elysia crispata]|uniref:Uncharacterized protein n=1 Tax=Elysia crispata TaxID=231223 RepID=A0AAE1D0G0_9GAST|nr:hypothetical protein RRG08_007713 [Elysia crispata]
MEGKENINNKQKKTSTATHPHTGPHHFTRAVLDPYNWDDGRTFSHDKQNRESTNRQTLASLMTLIQHLCPSALPLPL